MKTKRRQALFALLNGPRFNGDRKAFCAAASITNGRLSQLLDPKEPFGEVAARNLCESLSLPSDYFNEQAAAVNVDAARSISGDIPVISWVQAGSWREELAVFQPTDAERYLPIFRGHSSQTYALRVRGDSMTASHGKSYPEGCYIIVDPAKVTPNNGDRIIAKLDAEDAGEDAVVTFKVYKDEDGRKWLAPLNTGHLPIMDPFVVLGTVIGKWEDE